MIDKVFDVPCNKKNDIATHCESKQVFQVSMYFFVIQLRMRLSIFETAFYVNYCDNSRSYGSCVPFSRCIIKCAHHPTMIATYKERPWACVMLEQGSALHLQWQRLLDSYWCKIYRFQFALIPVHMSYRFKMTWRIFYRTTTQCETKNGQTSPNSVSAFIKLH